jgi:hypothetical protein
MVIRGYRSRLLTAIDLRFAIGDRSRLLQFN